MKKEYILTREDSFKMGSEHFLSKSKKTRWCLKYLKPLSILGASAYALIEPAESAINGEYHLIFTVVMTILVQIPLCSLILYFILKVILHAPLATLKKEIEKYPDAHWGKRTFSISETGLSLETPDTNLTVARDKIKGISETESFISLTDGENPLFILPKSIFSTQELQEALN